MVSIVEGCVVQWIRSDAPSVSTASDSVVFVAHNIWNPMMGYSFTCRLAASSKSLWRKLTWREWRFHVILLLIYHVTRREPVIPLNALLSTVATFALCPSGYIKEADASVDVMDASRTLRCQSGTVPCIQLP